MQERMTTRELLQMALDALESCISDPKMRHTDTVHYQIQDAEKALRAHIAKPEPEPVAWIYKSKNTGDIHLGWIKPKPGDSDDSFRLKALFMEDDV
jgi:hypothetical protein